MASNRAVDIGFEQRGSPIPTPTEHDKIEGLPTTGLFGKSPAMSIGVIMFVAQVAVRYAVERGYITPPSVEMLRFADDWGDDAAYVVIAAVSAAPSLIQAYWTKLKVFSPRSVWKRYFAPAEVARQAAR